ncbi:hypothetical protein BDV06DRAFT_195580 [Aspergillus oleicola]
MSFLTRLSQTTRTAPVARLTTFQSHRLLSTTTPLQKSNPVDATKSTLKKADRAVSDAAVKGIETGEAAASKIKQSVGSGEAQAQAKEKSGELKGEAQELAGKGKGKAQEVAGEAKGKAKEVAGEFKS